MPIHPEHISDIIRRDDAFVPTIEPRIGGGSASSGVFIERDTGKRWMGKANFIAEPRDTGAQVQRYFIQADRTEGEAIGEKIASDIYAYYGAQVARIEISRQRPVNSGLDELLAPDQYAVHVMSEIIPGFNTYKGLRDFNALFPNPNGHLRLSDGRDVPEVGLGVILAVAAFIDDIDVIGATGGNIGFQLETLPSGRVQARTIKIDPGAAFDNTPGIRRAQKRIRVMTSAEGGEETAEIDVSTLPPHTQREFFLTLHAIANTDDATIEGFFFRHGAEPFVVYKERSLQEYADQLCHRRDTLIKDFKAELAATKSDYAATEAAASSTYSLEEQAQHKEALALQKQLFFYVSPFVKAVTHQAVAAAAGAQQTDDARTVSAVEAPALACPILLQRFLDDPSPHARVLLLQSESGSGKSLTLHKLKKDLLLAQRDNPGASKVLHIELKHYTRDTVVACVEHACREAHLDMSDRTALLRTPLVLLLDGYDEIAGGSQANLYLTNQLAQYQCLKVIITCRTQALRPGYQALFAPYDIHGKLQLAHLQDHALQPFNEDQMRNYLTRYVAQHATTGFSVETYLEQINTLPGLKELVSRPLLLRIAADTLPIVLRERTAKEARGESLLPITAFELYEVFIRQWFANQEARVRTRAELPAGWDAFAAFGQFSESLALEMLHAGQVEVTYHADSTEARVWSRYLSDSDPDQVLARMGAPLTLKGDRHSFIHKSFWEYFAACGLCHLFERREHLEQTATVPADVWRDAGVIQFLREHYLLHQATIFDQLMAWVYASQNNPAWGRYAALAITVLNASGANFSGLDLQRIHIPHAELPGAFFHYTNLLGADLRGVNLQACYLHHTQLASANLSSAKLGQYPMLRLGDEVKAIAYNPHYHEMAIAVRNTIEIWDMDTQQCRVRCDGHTKGVTAVAYHPDGSKLASGSDDNTVRQWDVRTGAQITESRVRTGDVTAVAYSPDGNRLASGGYDKTVRQWDARTGAQITESRGHTPRVTAVAYHPDGSKLASGSWDKTVRQWDARTGAELTESRGHTESVTAVAYHPDGSKLASGSYDQTVRQWDARTGAEISESRGHTGWVMAVTYHPDGSKLASGSDDNTVRQWDARTGAQITESRGHALTVNAVAYHPGGNRLASGSADHTVRQWDVLNQAQVMQSRGHMDRVIAVAYHPDGKILASCSYDGTVRQWDVQTGIQLTESRMHSSKAVAYHPDGSRLASCNAWELVQWDVRTGAQVTKIQERRGMNCGVAYHPDGTKLASVRGATVSQQDVRTGKQLTKSRGHTSDINAVAYHPGGSKFASGSNDHTVRQWDVHTGTQATESLGHTDIVTSVAYHPDGTKLASCSKDSTMRQWDVRTGVQLTENRGHRKWVIAVAYHPGGQWLISGGIDRTIRIWDITGAEPYELVILVEGSRIQSVAINAEGLIAGMENGTIKCWQYQPAIDTPRWVLKWCTSSNKELCAAECQLEGAVISQQNFRVLEQIGAVGRARIEEAAMPAAAPAVQLSHSRGRSPGAGREPGKTAPAVAKGITAKGAPAAAKAAPAKAASAPVAAEARPASAAAAKAGGGAVEDVETAAVGSLAASRARAAAAKARAAASMARDAASGTRVAPQPPSATLSATPLPAPVLVAEDPQEAPKVAILSETAPATEAGRVIVVPVPKPNEGCVALDEARALLAQIEDSKEDERTASFFSYLSGVINGIYLITTQDKDSLISQLMQFIQASVDTTVPEDESDGILALRAFMLEALDQLGSVVAFMPGHSGGPPDPDDGGFGGGGSGDGGAGSDGSSHTLLVGVSSYNATNNGTGYTYASS